jgi:hypothetical protein
LLRADVLLEAWTPKVTFESLENMSVSLSLQFALGINTNMIATSSPTALGKYKYFQFISFFCGTFYT